MECVCIICNKPEDLDDKLRNPSSGVDKIAEYGKLFSKSGVLDYLKVVDQKDIRIHVSCQRNIGNEIRKKRKRKNGEDDGAPTSKMRKRSDGGSFHCHTHCLFCGDSAVQEEITKHPDRQASSFSCPESVDRRHLLEICGRPDMIDTPLAHTVRGRLMAINDINRCRYHRTCYRNFCREDIPSDEAPTKRPGRPINEEQCSNFAKLCEWLDKEAKQYTISELRSKMIEFAGSDENAYASNQYLKQNLQKRYGNKIYFSEVNGKPDVLCFKAIEGAASNVPLVGRVLASENVTLFEKVATVLRRDILERKQSFNGNFKPGCENESVSSYLVIFLSMVIDGQSLLGDKTVPVDEKALEKRLVESASGSILMSISQQIAFNTVDKRKSCGKFVRHSKNRTTPFPLYVGIKLYLSSTKIMIDVLASRGVSVSYSVVKGLSIDIANSVINHWNEKGIVVPPQAKKGLFTIIGFDNIDSNAKSSLSKSVSTLHGTIIVLHQFSNSISVQNGDQKIDILQKEQCRLQTVKPLPEYYFEIDEKYQISEDEKFYIPSSKSPVKTPDVDLPQFLSNEVSWLDHASELLLKNALDRNEWISWAAYHASVQPDISRMVTQLTSHVMPLLLQKSSDPNTIAHVFRIACQLTNYLNPGQMVMVETDCPLFQTGKKLQLKYPNEVFSEDKLFLSLGSLHIEKMLWTMSGDFQDGSGITTAFANSGIDTIAVGSFLICSNITKTRYHKQVLVLALEVLKQRGYRAYLDYESENGEDLLFGPKHSYQSWQKQIRAEQPQAEYYSVCQEKNIFTGPVFP